MKTDWRINELGKDFRVFSMKESFEKPFDVRFGHAIKFVVEQHDSRLIEPVRRIEGTLTKMEAGDLVLALLECLLP